MNISIHKAIGDKIGTVLIESPTVGVFFVEDDRVIAFPESLRDNPMMLSPKVKYVGGKHVHANLWPYIRDMFKYAGRWQDTLRGRVVYSKLDRKFQIVVGKKLANDKHIIDQVISQFKLPPNSVEIVIEDHYDYQT